MIEFVLNNRRVVSEQPAGLTVLDFVRYRKSLKGTKIGCREGDCGACTVLVGELKDGEVVYRSMTSCLMPMANAAGKHIVTVEGINPEDGGVTPVQSALIERGGTQCGFCTVGFVMSMTGFCVDHSEKTTKAAVSAVDGNICRCTGYKSIEKACGDIAEDQSGGSAGTMLGDAIKKGIVPGYFAGIKARLAEIDSRRRSGTTSATSLFLAGGTDLYVQRHDEMVEASAEHLFDDSSLRFIREADGFIELGASTVVTDLIESSLMNEIFPDLYSHLKLVSSTPIRNMATLAGNFVNASPIGDMTVWFLALDASVIFVNGREVPMRELYLDYKKLDKSDDEAVETIRFRKPTGDFRFGFEKVCKRTFLDIATVNTAISLVIEDGVIKNGHVAAGGVSPVPLYLKSTSLFLSGRRVNNETVKRAGEIMDSEISPISDVRGSKDYKRLLLRQLFKAHFMELFGPHVIEP
jgi:xanthine dehydrogenase small subunit